VVELDAPSLSSLPPNSAAAPPGTKEGDTRILSVTDRRLDALLRSSRREMPSEDLGGWRPVAPHQDPTETATPLREIDR
jgi:hypothetical protein